MTSPVLTVDTPAGTVRATAGPRQDDAVVFELGGAMRGSVHVTGTLHPHHWDQFTAVRACLGPVSAYQTTAPDDALPRLTRSRTRYHGSLTLYPDNYTDQVEVSVSPMTSTAGHEPSEKTAATLTAVLRACAAHVMERDDLPLILDSPGSGTLRPCCASSPDRPATTRPKPPAWNGRPMQRIAHGATPWPPGGPSPAGSPPDRIRSCC